MTTIDVPTDAAPGRRRVTREQQALAELGHTKRSRGTCEMLTMVFIATIVLVPLIENVTDLRANFSARRKLEAQGVPVPALPGRRPKSFEILDVMPSWREITSARTAFDLVALIPQPWRFRAYEDSLVLNSAAGKLIRPWTQWLLTAWLGVGNEKVLIGRDGWLFYGDGVEYVTGPGFLDPAQLNRRLSSGYDHSDPRRAIAQFSDELKSVGVSLIVLPVPDKLMIHPESFSPRVAASPQAPQNPSWDTFSRDLREHGVHLLDVSQEMYSAEANRSELFLHYDSHWNPAGADLAGRSLARFLEAEIGPPVEGAVLYRREPAESVRADDLIPLLGVPASRAARVSPPELYHTDRIVKSDGTRWKADPSSRLLVIGDSFLEYYIEDGAGLGAALSYYARRPVDVRASHRWGTYDAREALGKTLQEVRTAARGRRVIVWEFAIRRLAVNDWPLLR
jgi:alginate O-acetyltransferase complex protein AlgJ